MESLISTFHIDLNLFIAQLVNFAIVFSVLYFFAFKPLVKVMSERTEKIDQSLRDADAIEKRLALTATEQAEIIDAAKKQAALIIEEADKKGEVRHQIIVNRAKEEVGALVNSGREIINRDKAETLKEIKAEVAQLVVLTVEKILSERMDKDKDYKIIKDLIK